MTTQGQPSGGQLSSGQPSPWYSIYMASKFADNLLTDEKKWRNMRWYFTYK